MGTRTGRIYAFDNASRYAQAHHDALADLLDDFTRRRIAELADLSGKQCFEIGAGGGSIAIWLAEQVGPEGHVLAVDLKPIPIAERPNLNVQHWDITAGMPPGVRYDLAHARLLLCHLPQRRHILHRLASRLNPGGILLTQDWSTTPAEQFVITASTPQDTQLLTRFQDTHYTVMGKHGSDRTWATTAHQAMVEEGLIDVETVVHGRDRAGLWRGGGAGCRLVAAGLAQLRPELIAAGMTSAELDEVRRLLADPAVVLRGHLLYGTSGHRPPTGTPTAADPPGGAWPINRGD